MKPVGFTRQDAARISNVVRTVERVGNTGVGPYTPYRGDDGDGEPVRLGKTSAAWAKGTLATINVWESGTPPSETQTSGATLANCVNKFASVAAGKWVMLAKGANGSYYLIAAECS